MHCTAPCLGENPDGNTEAVKIPGPEGNPDGEESSRKGQQRAKTIRSTYGSEYLYFVPIFLKILNLNLAILPEAHQERLNMRLAASKTIN